MDVEDRIRVKEFGELKKEIRGLEEHREKMVACQCKKLPQVPAGYRSSLALSEMIRAGRGQWLRPLAPQYPFC